MNPSAFNPTYTVLDQSVEEEGAWEDCRVYKTRTGACRRIRELHRRDNDCYEWRMIRDGDTFAIIRGKNMHETTPGFQCVLGPDTICYRSHVYNRPSTEVIG